MEHGEIIASRYRLDRLLGEGGMGAVWAATHLITKKPIALKFLKSSTGDVESLRRRFVREAQAASLVHHANVVQIHDFLVLEQGDPVMVMDLLEGESLNARLRRLGRIPLSDLATILVPVVSAVGTAHAAGIVHRDLKPDNIFLERGSDGGIIPKVLDFGIAKIARGTDRISDTGTLTQTGALLGTPYYMAPEQAFGEKDVDHRVDVWALGVILYECLSGKRPVDGDSLGQLYRVLTTGDIRPLQQVARDVPEDVAALVGRMLSIDRTARPQDLREPFEVLRSYSSVAAVTFADARPRVITVDDGPQPPSSISFAGTEAAVAAPVASGRPPPGRSRALLLAGSVAGVFSLGVIVTLLAVRNGSAGGSDGHTPGASLATTVGSQDPSAVGATAAVQSAPAPAVSTPGQPDTQPPASASAVASSAASQRIAGNRPPAARSAAATGNPSAAPAVPPATPTKLPGGVVGDVPF